MKKQVLYGLILSAYILAVPSLVVSAENAAGTTANMLANAGFQELAAGGTPLAWEAASDPASIDAKLTVDTGPEGSTAVKLECNRLPDAANSSHGMLAQRGKVQLEAGRWYRLTFWARQRGIVGGAVNIAIKACSSYFCAVAKPMNASFVMALLATAAAVPAWAAEDFTGTKEVRLIQGGLGSPKAKTVVITDKAKIERLVGEIKLRKKDNEIIEPGPPPAKQ